MLATAGCERILGLDPPAGRAADASIDADLACVVDGFDLCAITPSAGASISAR